MGFSRTMKFSPVILATASGSLTDNTFQYPVRVDNIPDIGQAQRLKSSADINIPIITPNSGENTYVVFADNFRQALKIKKSREACDQDSESGDCKKDLRLLANVVFKITENDFSLGRAGFPTASDEEAILDRENKILTIKNGDFSNGGFWWSIHGSNQGNFTDLSYSHDKMSMIQIVNDCHVQATWDEKIDFNKYGWQKGSDGKLSFNEVGFREGDVFAECSFESSPPSLLKWDSDYVADEAAFGKVKAKVPCHRLLQNSVSCSVEEFDFDWDTDECKEEFESSVTDVMTPPSILDYTYSDENTGPVWKYVNKLDTADVSSITFTCPFLESADSVKVVSKNFISKNMLEADMGAMPMQVESEDLVFGGLEDTFDGKAFVISVRRENLDNGVQEFRCEYTLQQQILGFSKPFILDVFEESEDTPVEEPVIVWGHMVKDTKLIKQGEKTTNIAVCYQKAAGKPSGLQFGFLDANGVETHYTYPANPTYQHAISLNMEPIGITDKAGIFCRSSQKDMEPIRKDLGNIEIIRKPRKMVTNGIRNPKQEWIVNCLAETSSHDKVMAALCLNKNYKIEMKDGLATFNITGHFTEREQEHFQEKGAKCIFTSEQFPKEKFESNVWQIKVYKPTTNEDGGWPWGFLLMFFGLGCMLSICFGLNKAPPTQTDEEAGLLK